MIRLRPGDRAAARRVFGTGDEEVVEHALEALVGPFTCFHVASSFGLALGLELAAGGRVFVKATPREAGRERIAAARALQLALHERGLPAPRPLAGPVPAGSGDGHLVVDEWLDSGEFRDTHEPSLRREMAASLARLVRLATDVAPDAPLPPALEGLWDAPHNPRFDFARPEGRWIDEAAAEVRDAVFAPAPRTVVGHPDWNAQHVRWLGETISAIYDWELVRDSEENLVGYASAVFTATWELPVPKAPSLGEADAFVADYEAAAGRGLDRTRVAAARTYLTAYVARCELSDLGAEGDFQRALRAILAAAA